MIFVKNFLGREGGQHDQQYVKYKFVKNRVGGRGSTSIWIMSLNILFVFFEVTPNLTKLGYLTNLATSRHAGKLKFGTDTH